MYKPHVKYSAMKLHDMFGHYVLAQLRKEPALAAEAEMFTTAQADLARRQEEHRQTVGLTIERMAARDADRIALSEALRSFSYAVRLAARNDFLSPIYLGYFPEGSAKVTSGTIEDCISQAQSVLRQLETETLPELLVHVERITTALEIARACLQALRDARDAKLAASKVLYLEKVRWVDIYLQVYARLRLYHHRSPRRAEGYFRKGKSWRPDETTEEVVESGSSALAAADDSPNAGDDAIAA
jgi:hypothetical protein